MSANAPEMPHPAPVNHPRKAELMEAIQELLAKGKTPKARIYNADSTVKGDIDLADLAPEKQTLVPAAGLPELVPDSVVEFSKLTPALRLRFRGKNDGDLGEIKAILKREYVAAARSASNGFTAGVCTRFAGVVIGTLATPPGTKLLYAGIKVERMDFARSNGHAFVVVNRFEGELNDPATWGEHAFIIDAWYGRHFKTEPGMIAVKNVTGQPGDLYLDPAFNAWIKQGFAQPTAFDHTILTTW